MIDHIGLKVADLARSKAFYKKVLAEIGYDVLHEGEGYCGFGPADGKPDFWLSVGPATGGTHVAFHAAARETVQAFYAAGLKAGGKDNGPPGIREQYHPKYYGAFVLDPDGHNVEAVTFND